MLIVASESIIHELSDELNGSSYYITSLLMYTHLKTKSFIFHYLFNHYHLYKNLIIRFLKIANLTELKIFSLYTHFL